MFHMPLKKKKNTLLGHCDTLYDSDRDITGSIGIMELRKIMAFHDLNR